MIRMVDLLFLLLLALADLLTATSSACPVGASALFGTLYAAVLVSPLTKLAMNSGRAWRTTAASFGSSMSIR
jgi:hypothetical protein